MYQFMPLYEQSMLTTYTCIKSAGIYLEWYKYVQKFLLEYMTMYVLIDIDILIRCIHAKHKWVY